MPTVASTLCPPPCAKWEIRYSHLHMVGHCLSPLTNKHQSLNSTATKEASMDLLQS